MVGLISLSRELLLRRVEYFRKYLPPAWDWLIFVLWYVRCCHSLRWALKLRGCQVEKKRCMSLIFKCVEGETEKTKLKANFLPLGFRMKMKVKCYISARSLLHIRLQPLLTKWSVTRSPGNKGVVSQDYCTGRTTYASFGVMRSTTSQDSRLKSSLGRAKCGYVEYVRVMRSRSSFYRLGFKKEIFGHYDIADMLAGKYANVKSKSGHHEFV